MNWSDLHFALKLVKYFSEIETSVCWLSSTHGILLILFDGVIGMIYCPVDLLFDWAWIGLMKLVR
jgi:hypothetical protein